MFILFHSFIHYILVDHGKAWVIVYNLSKKPLNCFEEKVQCFRNNMATAKK